MTRPVVPLEKKRENGDGLRSQLNKACILYLPGTNDCHTLNGVLTMVVEHMKIKNEAAP